MSALATCYTHLRKFNDAYELFDKCIETSKLMNGEDYHTTITYKLSLRECLEKINNDDRQSAICLSKLSVSCMETSQYDEAEKWLVECLEISRRIDGENHSLLLIS